MPLRILVVDDEPDILDVLVRGLPEVLGPGTQMLAARSPMEALELLKAQEVDVILSDDRMPQARGRDLLAWAAAERPQAIRVLMTAYFGLMERPTHAQLVVPKPFRFSDVALQVRLLLDARDRARAAAPA